MINYKNLKNKLIIPIFLKISKSSIKERCNLIRLRQGKISIIDYICLYVLFCELQNKTYKQFYTQYVKINFKNCPNYVNFLRNIRKLKPILECLLEHKLKQNRVLFEFDLKESNIENLLFLDSTKIEISRPTWNGKIGNKISYFINQEVDKQSYGYTSCGKFKGYKLNLVLDAKNRILNLNLFTGKNHDINILKEEYGFLDFLQKIKNVSQTQSKEKPFFIIADSGYISKERFVEFKEKNILILSKRKKNLKNPYYNKEEELILKENYPKRQKIERFFKKLKEDLNCKNLYLARNINSVFNKLLINLLTSQLI